MLQAVARAIRGADQLDVVARQESFEQMQREVMCSGIERNADSAVGELLRRVDGRLGRHDDRCVGNDRAAADLAALHIRVADAAVIAPFACVVHVGLALLEQLAMAAEGVDAVGRAGEAFDGLDAGLVAIVPFDEQAFFFE